MKTFLGCCVLVLSLSTVVGAELSRTEGLASWYGEEHRGKLMANGEKFDPDKLTAASWHYPLGTRVRVTVNSAKFPTRQVTVTITDRGPAEELVRKGRVIDLGRAAFEKLAPTDLGLIPVVVEPETK